jgi:hypothetical protein
MPSPSARPARTSAVWKTLTFAAALQAPGQVQQAAQVAAEEGVGAGLGQAGELVVGEAAGDLRVFHAEAAAEAAAHLGVGHLGELQPAHAAEQQARLGLDAELAQARAGVEVADGAGVGGVTR